MTHSTRIRSARQTYVPRPATQPGELTQVLLPPGLESEAVVAGQPRHRDDLERVRHRREAPSRDQRFPIRGQPETCYWPWLL